LFVLIGKNTLYEFSEPVGELKPDWSMPLKAATEGGYSLAHIREVVLAEGAVF